jgi:hypothetical protein
VHDFEQIARPVIFEHSDEAIPYWGKGSSMLLANRQYYFWITASHVLKNLGGSVEALRIFPLDDARISLPFDAQYTIKTSVSEDEDHRDVFALRINITEFEAFGDAPLIAQDTELGLLPAEDLKVGTVLWIIGYPAERDSIDYEQARINNSRAVIRAVYQGASVSDHCHVARVNSSISLEAYDGLSGSPVFYLHPVIHNGQVLLFPQVVGMLLRGTASSNLVHFVSARVIGELIRLACDGDA